MWSPTEIATSVWTQQPHVLLLLASAVLIAGRSAHSWLAAPAKDSGKGTGAAHQSKQRPDGTLPLFYNTFHVAKHKHRYGDWLIDQVASFGGQPFWLKILAGPDIYVLTHPEQFEDVLKTQFEAFGKGEQMSTNLRDLVGDGIFGVDGHKWMRQRKTASNLFSLRALRESMTASIQKHALVLNSIFAQAAVSNERIDMFKLLNRFTIETFAEIGFGVELDALDSTKEHPFQVAFDSAQRILIQRFTVPGFVWKTLRCLNIGAERQLKEHIRVIDTMVFDIIHKALAKRKSASLAHSREQCNIVSLFLDNASNDSADSAAAGESPNAGDDGFDPKFLRDIVVNFLIAGRDTTAQALSWFFYLLSEYPHIEAKIRAELVAKLPQLVGGAIATPSMEHTSELVYLEAALRETLRLHPSVPLNSRTANRDVVLNDGTLIKKGNKVSISSYVLARMTHVWGDDAAQFKPERWIDAASGKIVQVSAFKFPAFNAGPRMCLGMNLAMTEMKIVASMVLSKFHLALVPGQHVTYDLSLTHPIKGELLMTVELAS